MQELRGIDAFARATRLLERGPITDPLIPYAILLERPRRAGKRLTALAAVESGDREIAKGWRSERFISLPALLSAVTAAAGVGVAHPADLAWSVLATALFALLLLPVLIGVERFLVSRGWA